MTLEEKVAMIEKLVAEVIEEAGCGDPECGSCKIGLALGDGEVGLLKCIDTAFEAGYKAHEEN